MKTPKVSVIMPAYNVEQYIKEAIDSILNQTFQDFEFIILNDGSTDNTAQIVRSFKDKRIKFIDNPYNQGFIASLNQCLDIAKGEYIAKMDSDDISLPERLEKQVKYLDNNPQVGLVGTGYKAFGKKEFIVIHPQKSTYLDLLQGCCTTIFMCRKSTLDKNNLRFRKEYLYAEDYDFYARFIKSAPIHNIQEVLYLYRWHGNNVSIKQSKAQTETTRKIQQELLDFLSTDTKVQEKILHLVSPLIKKHKYYLFNFIPILKVKQKNNSKTYYLFHFIPTITLKREEK
ncbi:MAG TPA: glycosyl transferase [Alphaproteobacteria bacterium]|nr:glycosyl transferase [Alphaproteobacteria bacterium]